MSNSPRGMDEEAIDVQVVEGTLEPVDAGSSAVPSASDDAPHSRGGPEYKDQVRGDASITPVHIAMVEETQSPVEVQDASERKDVPPPSRLPSADDGPSFKDQARSARPSAIIGPASVPPSHIALPPPGGGPDYKDQAQPRSSSREENHNITAISEITLGVYSLLSSAPTGVLPVWSTPTMEAEIVSAHLVAESVSPDSDHPVFLTAQVVDMKKERRRMVFKASTVIVVILVAVLVPTFLLTFRDGQSSAESEVTDPMTPPSALETNTTTTTAPSFPAPTAAPSISWSPSAAPTMSHRYLPLGDPIATDLVTGQRGKAALSSNGTVVAIANNDTVQVYRQNVSTTSGAVTWVPLGPPVPAVAERATTYEKNFTLSLAPDALVLAVGIPSFQESAGRVDVYDYDRASDLWVTRGESFLGNSTDLLGYDVALSADGLTVAMAASNYSSGVSYATVWSWNATTETWLFYGRVDGFAGAPSLSIALADPRLEYQGPRIVLGDPRDGIVGQAEVHECNQIDGCSLLGSSLQGPDYEDFFGFSVSISRNGFTIAIGSPGIIECREFCANVKVYEFGRGTECVWTLVGQELFGMIGFGEKVKLSETGASLVVYYSSYDLLLPSYTQVYQLQSGIWVPVGAPLYAEFLDMSYDGTVFATILNGDVVLQTFISHDVSNNFG